MLYWEKRDYRRWKIAQSKAFDESVSVRNTNSLLYFSMPYCEAIALETLRMFMAYTFGIPHRAMRDTKLCGYDIPKVILSEFV